MGPARWRRWQSCSFSPPRPPIQDHAVTVIERGQQMPARTACEPLIRAVSCHPPRPSAARQEPARCAAGPRRQPRHRGRPRPGSAGSAGRGLARIRARDHAALASRYEGLDLTRSTDGLTLQQVADQLGPDSDGRASRPTAHAMSDPLAFPWPAGGAGACTHKHVVTPRTCDTPRNCTC